MLCKPKGWPVEVGDHEVWFGEVVEVLKEDSTKDPLVYYQQSYRSVGDELFIDAFENATLSFNQWTHRAHLRFVKADLAAPQRIH